jgi:hypothetical protein
MWRSGVDPILLLLKFKTSSEMIFRMKTPFVDGEQFLKNFLMNWSFPIKIIFFKEIVARITRIQSYYQGLEACNQ